MGDVRVYVKPDGALTISHPAPQSRIAGERKKDWLERTWARVVEVTPEFADLPYFDTTTEALPAYAQKCTQPHCDQEHSVRDMWSARDDTVYIDDSVPNVQALLYHLWVLRIKEIESDTASAITLARIELVMQRISAILITGTRSQIKQTIDDNMHLLGK